jgi:hypothetical protein
MIIGIVGESGTGKDTLADFLVESGYKKLALLDVLKEFLQRVYVLDDQQLWGDYKEAVDARYNVSTRQIMQDIGAAFRQFNETVWIDLALREVKGRDVVISDVRLVAEARKVKSAGGHLWRLIADGSARELGDLSKDPTETEQREMPVDLFDATLTNQFGNPEILLGQAERLLAKTP